MPRYDAEWAEIEAADKAAARLGSDRRGGEDMADCDEVAARMNANMKAYRDRLHARGLCIRCRKPLGRERAGKSLCSECAVKQSGYCKTRYYRLKKAGLCTTCGRRVDPGKTLCRKCLLFRAENQREYRRRAEDERAER